MSRWSAPAMMKTIALSVLLWAAIAAACLTIGSTGIGWPSDRYTFAFRRDVILLSSLVGAALSAAGVTYQAILRNPLADPYLLGVSSGAALFAYAWRLPALAGMTLALGVRSEAATQQVFAFCGALLSIGLVLLIAGRRGRLEPVTLLLVGVIINALNGSVFLFIYSLFGTFTSEGALSMFVGGIQTILTPQQVVSATVIAGVCWIGLMALAGRLNAAGVSDVEAEALGVRIQRLRWTALIVASLMTAAAVAISGPIGFIGLICPHLARLIVGTDQRRLLPVATALGAATLALAESVSRGLAGEGLLQTQLPVGVLTSLLGGPFFLLLLIQSRRRLDRAEGA